MIQEIINFVETLPDDVFPEKPPKEGLYILLDIDENGNLMNVDENGYINKLDIEKYLEKDEAENGLSEHLTLCKKIYLNSQVMGKGVVAKNKSFNSSAGMFITVATPFGIGFRKGIFNDDKKTIEIKIKAIKEYFNSAKAYLGEDATFQEWFRRFELFCKKHLLKVIEQHGFMRNDTKDNPNEYGIKDKEFIHFFLRLPSVADYKKVNQAYLAERIFNDAEETSKGKFGVYSTTHVLNESKVFLRHQTGLTEKIRWLSGEEAAKVEQFYTIQKFLPKPFPLFIYENEREELIKVFRKNSKIKYSEIFRKLTEDGKDELHNYYLIFFSGADYSRVIDIDFVSTFQFSTNIVIKKIFPLNKDDINSKRINDVFEFEQEVVKPILNIHPDNFINYFGEEKFDTKYTTHNYFNQFLKYRKAFFDYIYKSKREAISQKMFDDILLKGILDDIRTDEYTVEKNRNENRLKIFTKLNIWFSLYHYFHSSNYKYNTDMNTKIERHRKKIDAIIMKDSEEVLKAIDEFAYAAGHCVRYLFEKSETKYKSYRRLENFIQKTDCRQLLSAIANFFAMYKHKNMTNAFGRLFTQVMEFETDENMKQYLPEFLAGFFDNNKLFSEQSSDENSNPNFKGRVTFDFSLLGKSGRERIESKELLNVVYRELERYATKNDNFANGLIEFITKKSASEFYQMLSQDKRFKDYQKFLISGTILEARRQEVIRAIETKTYKGKTFKKSIIVTTQVVEAGVDIDMDIGFKDRSLVDSDEQLAGRINRNASKNDCKVFIFNYDRTVKVYGKDRRHKQPLSFATYQKILKSKNFDLHYNAVNEEINRLNESEIYENFQEYLKNFKRFNFRKVQEDFKLIDTKTISVFVPLDIDRRWFSEAEKQFLDAFNYDFSEGISGDYVFKIYRRIIAVEQGFVEKIIDKKQIGGIMSKFMFSIFTNSKLEQTLRCYYDHEIFEQFGLIYLSQWKDIYTLEGGLDNTKLGDASNQIV
ncbi:MAG: hypothetical protein AAF849_22145 [Bacteroidota bacterium]